MLGLDRYSVYVGFGSLYIKNRKSWNRENVIRINKRKEGTEIKK